MDNPETPEFQGNPETETAVETAAPEALAIAHDETSEPDKPELFSDKFDPTTLDESLQPAYKNMQAEWTRKNMEFAEQRKQYEADIEFLQTIREDEEARAELFKMLAEEQGYALEDGEGELDEPDPIEELRGEFDEFKTQQQQSYLRNSIERQFGEIGEVRGSELTDAEKQKLVRYAAAIDERDGEPDIRGAYDEITSLLKEQKQAWIDSKDTTPPPPSGKAGVKEIDLTNEKARREHMAKIMAREGAST